MYLDIPHLPLEVRRAYIFPALTHDALISILQLCDHGYIAVFDQNEIYILKDGNIAWSGGRYHKTSLYMIELANKKKHSQIPASINETLQAIPTSICNNKYEIRNKKDIVTYYSQCCFIPSISTWSAVVDADFLHLARINKWTDTKTRTKIRGVRQRRSKKIGKTYNQQRNQLTTANEATIFWQNRSFSSYFKQRVHIYYDYIWLWL